MAAKKPAGRIHGATRSGPGEPPYKQTGRLRAGVTHEVLDESAKITARVGTNLPYGRHLELGTRKMAARPWLRRALDECRAEITRLF
jgi:phage gpG-like protein